MTEHERYARDEDDLDADTFERIGRRGTRVRSHTRGRLTEEARERLADQPDEPEVDLPDEGDRWAGWMDADARGPEPVPDWVLTDGAAVDTDLGVLKTGKEADVFLVERRVPETGAWCLLASKRYRSADHRLFHRDAGYLEGRRLKESRQARAVANRTKFGRNLIAQQWAVTEFEALGSLYAAGVAVPYPVQRTETELLLEFVGESDGTAAPRLAELRPDPSKLAMLWDRLFATMAAMAAAGYTHGDMSAYNVLVQYDEPVLIDVPQLVDLTVNPRGIELLERDVRNIGNWFAQRGLEFARDTAYHVETLVDAAGLSYSSG